MLETFIASYISTLNEDLVMEYAKKEQNYDLSFDEARIITNFLKTYWQDLIHEKTTCFQTLKASLCEETYHRVIQLYEEKKKLYLN